MKAISRCSSSEAAFLALTDGIQQIFDAVIDSGSEQQLFVSGYLNGHFSLVVSQCLQAAQFTAQDLDHAMQLSLATAFAQGELEPADQQQVRRFWQDCLNQY